MKILSVVLGLGLLAPWLIHGGTITGTVRAEGKDSANGEGGGKYDSRKFKFVERINYAELRDFVVYIDLTPTNKPAAPVEPVQVTTTKKISQRGASFNPRVLPVVVGTTVEWPNFDEIYHNVFSISDAKPFDLGLYKQPEVKKVTFDKAGRVDVFCSIHTSMNCIILVLENPWFGTVDERGRYTISNVPAGTYKLKAWHERLPSQIQEIVVHESGETKADFTLGITNLPKY